MMTGYSRCFVY